MMDTKETSHLAARRSALIHQAASDFFFLQNRLYPRSSALEWVGNRYALEAAERHLLQRGVFGQQEALRRRARRCMGDDWQNGLLVVDGYNVQITVESAILGRPLLLANDGAMRDIAGQSAGYRFSRAGEMAVDVVFRLLDEYRPRKVLFLFDAPMSHSGQLASLYRRRLQELGIPGGSHAVPVPEREIPYGECVTASSDHAILDASGMWIDLARRAIAAARITPSCVDFSWLTTPERMSVYEE